MARYLIPVLVTALLLGRSVFPGHRPDGPRLGSPSQPPALALQACPVDFGILGPGRRASRVLTLRNRTPDPVTVERFQSSCPCLKVVAEKLTVRASGETRVGLSFDPSDEPDFRGRLAIIVTGLGTDGTTCLNTDVSVEVR